MLQLPSQYIVLCVRAYVTQYADVNGVHTSSMLLGSVATGLTRFLLRRQPMF